MPRSKKPWFRWYVGTVRDPKIRRLPVGQKWLWVVCLEAARESPEPGWLWLPGNVPLEIRDLADAAGVSVAATTAGIKAFEATQMLTKTETGWFVTNWWDRQFESDVERPH